MNSYNIIERSLLSDVLTFDDIFPRYKLNYDSEKNVYTLKLDLPGFTKEEVKAEVVGKSIVVTAKNSETTVTESLYIGKSIQFNGLSGELKDGVLTITFKTVATASINIEIK